MSALTINELLSKARWQAARAVPYLARSLWAMTFVETSEIPTAAIDDKWRVYYNPDYIKKCATDGTLIGELFHECLHPTLRHSSRSKVIQAADHEHWNRAGDAELDQQIEAAGVKLVDDRVRPENFKGGAKGMTAEELYKLPSDGSGKSKSGKPKCSCGGGSGAGRPMPFEGKGGSEKKLPTGLSEAEADLIRVMTAQAIKEHVAKGRGSVPAGFLRWAETFGEPPPVDWRAMVQAKVRYAIDTHRGPSPSYARPSRRNITGGLVLPVHRMPIPRIALVPDTSGSMYESDIATELACVVDACEALGKVYAVPCDAAASDPVEIRHVDDLKEFMKGGGGTDMRVGIERALECNPDAIVVITDGDTPWPDEEPEVPVTVVLTREPYCDPPPAWAAVVRVYSNR